MFSVCAAWLGRLRWRGPSPFYSCTGQTSDPHGRWCSSGWRERSRGLSSSSSALVSSVSRQASRYCLDDHRWARSQRPDQEALTRVAFVGQSDSPRVWRPRIHALQQWSQDRGLPRHRNGPLNEGARLPSGRLDQARHGRGLEGAPGDEAASTMDVTSTTVCLVRCSDGSGAGAKPWLSARVAVNRFCDDQGLRFEGSDVSKSQ
jgi:hypothetical protein